MTTIPLPPQLQQVSSDSRRTRTTYYGFGGCETSLGGKIRQTWVQTVQHHSGNASETCQKLMKEILHNRMWKSKSYQTHEDHMMLYDALEKSMAQDNSDQLMSDLAEERKKKKKRQGSPKTPPGFPPHPPPPPPPSASPSGTS
ncbi:hypothetical protein Tco_0043345 [Tanacetum coccineum]